jgi:hypothetical protein
MSLQQLGVGCNCGIFDFLLREREWNADQQVGADAKRKFKLPGTKLRFGHLIYWILRLNNFRVGRR